MTKEELRNYRCKKLELDHLRYMMQKDSEDKDFVALYEEKSKALDADLRRIENAIASLGPTERDLIRLRYIEGLSWQAVSFRIHYSLQQIHRIHKNALIKLGRR